MQPWFRRVRSIGQLKFTWPAVMLAWTSLSCTPPQFTTMTLYDTPHAFVRLEADPTVEKGAGHRHPVNLMPEQVAAVLAGVMIEEPLAKMPIYDEMGGPRRHRVFDENLVAFFAPLLALALAQATPEEVITFYLSKDLSGGTREVTSGGLFVQDEERLHLVLGNYRSHTHYMADLGVAETTDDRLTPMLPLAPQRGRLGFEPPSAATLSSSGWSKFFKRDRRELIVLFRQLTPQSVSQSPSASPQIR
jgi:hypothetical protein